MILRTAALHQAPYEWQQHRRMAREIGVTDEEVAELPMWRSSRAFRPAERAALALTDAIVAGHVPAEVNEEVGRRSVATLSLCRETLAKCSPRVK